MLENYILGKWIKGDGEGQKLFNSVTGEIVNTVSTKGIDFGEVLHYGREVGSPALRKMTFQERGLMLKALALHLHSIKDKYYPISYMTGATKVDSWIDIEGGIGNLFANASLRRQFPDSPFHVDGDSIPLSRKGPFMGHHIMVPKEGVAVHINAFNFPIWGMLEKVAVNLMAGVPAVVKPATVTCFVTEAMVRDIVASGILPPGSIQLILGSARGITDHVDMQDVVTFTGSAVTGQMLKASPKVIQNSVPFNMEADSLNSCVLGEDAVPGTPEFDIFIKEIRKEMTVKCGQKCTAIRRILVPENLIEDVQKALSTALAKTAIGNPTNEKTRMGALAGMEQMKELKTQIDILNRNSDMVYGHTDVLESVLDADAQKGAFVSPVLFRQNNPLDFSEVHEIEAFGPVSTIMPYKDIEDAIRISKLGKGSLVSSIVTNDDKLATEYVLGAASYHGRILTLNRECAPYSTGHGSPLPLLVHGGPGRAGGGEEMGGMRGVKHYMQRTAIQGSPTTISAITKVFQQGADYIQDGVHPFRKHFEEINVGDTEITAKHTITEADISNFANVSGDNFYAHVDATSLDGTIFEQRVAHGYYVLSKAAGLFVDPKKGPVLLNYGLEECRFTKPVYPGMTIGVRFTAKEKISQEKKDEEDIAKGIVKFLVDVYDETGETVAIATILTMVRKLDQSK